MIPIQFNDDWYVITETPGKEQATVGPISVPYDAMIQEKRDEHLPFGSRTGFYPGGKYRYKKTIQVPAEWVGLASIQLQFEGVYHRSKVYINGQLAGGRPNGYTLFHVSIEKLLNFEAGNKNLIEVVADTRDHPNSRWYTGSGIYRPVQLLLGAEARIKPFGVRVTTLSLEGSSAVVEVASTVVLPSSPAEYSLSVKLTTAAGVLVAPIATTSISASSGPSSTITNQFLVKDANLWSPDSPTLHSIQVELLSNTTILDVLTDDFGIRTLSCTVQSGLLINNQRVLLRGACVHHDNGIIGANTFDAAEDRRVRILKENGYNSIRSSHNSAALAMLRACDKYGVLVMDELTDMWLVAKTKYDYHSEFLDWWEQDAESMVAKDYNHPSVIMYSIGNEIAETSQPSGIAQSAAMMPVLRKMDSSRPWTNCINGLLSVMALNPSAVFETLKKAGLDVSIFDQGPAEKGSPLDVERMNFFISAWENYMPELTTMPVIDKATAEAFSHVDVAGGNYMTHRVESDITAYPDRIYVGSETGMDIFDAWKLVEKYPQVLGDFVWTGWDYIGEAGLATPTYDSPRTQRQPYPAQLAGAACIDINGFPQGQVFLSQVVWNLTGNNPVISVNPLQHYGKKFMSGLWRKTDSFKNWNWVGYEGKGASVEVYSRSPQVRLELNGEIIGTQPSGPDCQFLARFDTVYQPGTLTAVALDANGKEIGRDTLSSGSDAKSKLTVRSEVQTLRSDASDLAYIPIEITDSHGVVLPLADRKVKVAVTGAGTLLGLGSANPTTAEGYVSTEATTYYGRALAVIRSGLAEGVVKVVVSAEGCEDVGLEIPVVA